MSQIQSYNTLLKEKVECMRQENAAVLDQYRQHYDSVKAGLEKNSDKYKVLKEKEIELKKVQFRVFMLQARINEQKEIKKKRREIQQQIFYNFWIRFAKAWLDNRKYEIDLQKLREVTAKREELMKKYLESCERLKEAQRAAALRKKQGATNMNKVTIYILIFFTEYFFNS